MPMSSFGLLTKVYDYATLRVADGDPLLKYDRRLAEVASRYSPENTRSHPAKRRGTKNCLTERTRAVRQNDSILVGFENIEVSTDCLLEAHIAVASLFRGHELTKTRVTRSKLGLHLTTHIGSGLRNHGLSRQRPEQMFKPLSHLDDQ